MGKQPLKPTGKKTKAYKATQNSRGSRRRSPIQGSPFNNPLQYQELPPQSFYHTQIPPHRRGQPTYPPTYPPTYLPTVYVNPNPYMHPYVQQPQPQPQRHVIRNLNDFLNVSYSQAELDALTRPPSPEPHRNGLYRQPNYPRGGRSKKYSRKNRRK